MSDLGTAQAVNRRGLWAAYTMVLLLGLATGSGLLRTGVFGRWWVTRSRSNYRTASTLGFWIAMAVAMIVYLYGGYDLFTEEQTIYLVGTPAVAAALVVFASLEMRALRSE